MPRLKFYRYKDGSRQGFTFAADSREIADEYAEKWAKKHGKTLTFHSSDEEK